MVYTQVIKREQGHVYQEIRMMAIFKKEGRVCDQGRTQRTLPQHSSKYLFVTHRDGHSEHIATVLMRNNLGCKTSKITYLLRPQSDSSVLFSCLFILIIQNLQRAIYWLFSFPHPSLHHTPHQLIYAAMCPDRLFFMECLPQPPEHCFQWGLPSLCYPQEIRVWVERVLGIINCFVPSLLPHSL